MWSHRARERDIHPRWRDTENTTISQLRILGRINFHRDVLRVTRECVCVCVCMQTWRKAVLSVAMNIV